MKKNNTKCNCHTNKKNSCSILQVLINSKYSPLLYTPFPIFIAPNDLLQHLAGFVTLIM
jgi:hypothetical protein